MTLLTGAYWAGGLIALQALQMTVLAKVVEVVSNVGC